MTDLVLHHYGVSPFAEKIRAALGYKQLAWRSVEIPVVMPKPDLVALTGGYRKTPVLQVGNHVYCDTWLIARVLEAREPARPLLAPQQMGVGAAAARWFDRDLFFAVLSQLGHPAVAAASAKSLGGPAQAQAFALDRRTMMSAARVRVPRPVDGLVIVQQTLQQLEAQLGFAGPFLMGQALGWVDLCAYHPLWSLRNNEALAPQLESYPGVVAWLDRIRVHGHGDPTPMSSREALDLCRSSGAATFTEASRASVEKLALGDEVAISAADYAHEASTGRLVYVDHDELAIERDDPRAGRVFVHFPRVGYRIEAASVSPRAP